MADQTVPQDNKKLSVSDEKERLVKKKGKTEWLRTEPVSKFLDMEDQQERQTDVVSGVEVASALGNMSQGGLQEVVDNAPREFSDPRCLKRKRRTKEEKVGHQQQGLLHRSLACNASGLLGGNQAKRAIFFKASCSGSHVGPQSAKPGRCSSPEPASFTGVVAGTKVVRDAEMKDWGTEGMEGEWIFMETGSSIPKVPVLANAREIDLIRAMRCQSLLLLMVLASVVVAKGDGKKLPRAQARRGCAEQRADGVEVELRRAQAHGGRDVQRAGSGWRAVRRLRVERAERAEAASDLDSFVATVSIVTTLHCTVTCVPRTRRAPLHVIHAPMSLVTCLVPWQVQIGKKKTKNAGRGWSAGERGV